MFGTSQVAPRAVGLLQNASVLLLGENVPWAAAGTVEQPVDHKRPGNDRACAGSPDTSPSRRIKWWMRSIHMLSSLTSVPAEPELRTVHLQVDHGCAAEKTEPLSRTRSQTCSPWSRVPSGESLDNAACMPGHLAPLYRVQHSEPGRSAPEQWCSAASERIAAASLTDLRRLMSISRHEVGVVHVRVNECSRVMQPRISAAARPPARRRSGEVAPRIGMGQIFTGNLYGSAASSTSLERVSS